eukprot:gene10487-12252_t
MGDTAKPIVIDEHTKKILAVKALMRERDVARVESDFGKSDTLRDKLMTEYGVTIFDQNGGPSGWKFQDGSTKKLPAGIIEAKLPGAVKLEKRKREEGSDEKTSKTAKVVKKDKEVVKPKAKAALKPAVVQENNRNSALVNSILGAGSSDTVKTVQGVKIEEKKIGSGKVAVSGKRIKVHYVGKLPNGNTFDACTKKPFPFRLGAGEVIRGWDIGCDGMAVGGKRRLTIPPEKAYGKAGAPPTIPGNATLIFDVTLLEVC